MTSYMCTREFLLGNPLFSMAGKTEDVQQSVPEKVLQYEKFLNETLKSDLKRVVDERDKLYSQLAEYHQLKNIIERIQESKLEGGELKTQVDLGCNFYVQAKVPDTSRIMVYVGFGFYVEFTLDEALPFIDKKVSQLTKSSDELTKQAAKIKAHIKFVVEGLRELQYIDDLPAEKPQRDIFA